MKGIVILVLSVVALAIATPAARKNAVEVGAKRCKGHAWTEDNQETLDYLRPHKNCKKFWSCTAAGDAYEMDCPAGLDFSPSAKICDWPDQAGCDGDDSGDSSSSSSSSSEEPEGPGSPEEPEGPGSPEEPEGPCSSSSSSSSESCEGGDSGEKGDCNEAACEGHAWTEDNQETLDYLLPLKDCTKFCSCTAAGEGVEMDCPAGLEFSAENKICDWPNLAKCS